MIRKGGIAHGMVARGCSGILHYNRHTISVTRKDKTELRLRANGMDTKTCLLLVIPCLFMQYEKIINGLGSYRTRRKPSVIRTQAINIFCIA